METGCSIWFSRPARALARKRAECRRLLDAEARAIEDEAAAVKSEIDRLLKLGRTSQEEVRELGATIRRSVEGSVANIYATYSVVTTRVENIVRLWLPLADIDPVENEYEFIKTRVQVTSSRLSFESNKRGTTRATSRCSNARDSRTPDRSLRRGVVHRNIAQVIRVGHP
jgi:hypothetical protein